MSDQISKAMSGPHENDAATLEVFKTAQLMPLNGLTGEPMGLYKQVLEEQAQKEARDTAAAEEKHLDDERAAKKRAKKLAKKLAKRQRKLAKAAGPSVEAEIAQNKRDIEMLSAMQRRRAGRA